MIRVLIKRQLWGHLMSRVGRARFSVTGWCSCLQRQWLLETEESRAYLIVRHSRGVLVLHGGCNCAALAIGGAANEWNMILARTLTALQLLRQNTEGS
jgi:hypothetical protein